MFGADDNTLFPTRSNKEFLESIRTFCLYLEELSQSLQGLAKKVIIGHRAGIGRPCGDCSRALRSDVRAVARSWSLIAPIKNRRLPTKWYTPYRLTKTPRDASGDPSGHCARERHCPDASASTCAPSLSPERRMPDILESEALCGHVAVLHLTKWQSTVISDPQLMHLFRAASGREDGRMAIARGCRSFPGAEDGAHVEACLRERDSSTNARKGFFPERSLGVFVVVCVYLLGRRTGLLNGCNYDTDPAYGADVERMLASSSPQRLPPARCR